jgi:polar amino acid transport system substrate-binding protein
MYQTARLALIAAVGAIVAAPGRTAPTTMHFVTKAFAPYAYAAPDGRPAGPMVELLHAACAEAGWHCTVEVLPWRRALGMALRSEVDGVFPVVSSAARRSAFHLSPEIVHARYALFARQDRWTPRTELSGRTIAAYGPSDATTTLLQLTSSVPGVEIEIEPDHQTVLRKLSAGRYGDNGLALVNEAVAQALHYVAGGAPLQRVGVVKHLSYAFALAPQRVSAAQALAFDEAIHALCRSGRTARIFKPYGLPAADCQRAAS